MSNGYDSVKIPASNYLARIEAAGRKIPGNCPLTSAVPKRCRAAFFFSYPSSGIEQLLRCVATWLRWLATNRRLLWSLIRRFEHIVTVTLAKSCGADADPIGAGLR